ncbi:hypothetical protein [Apibacter sp. HY039]|uniref:hypothetical protein n=1 Tax=Apibacter sp. HY039 TaxID=2501476 RepID=UPI000FEB9411|nr:hypothetical protein [Apibacter sp. HY039]
MKKSWVIISLFYFFLAALAGLILRFSQLYNLQIPYNNFLHTHSHIALLGWLFLMYYTIIYDQYIPDNQKTKRSYNILFQLTQLSVLGMLVSFPFQGYAFFSILFSTLYIVCAYVFCYVTWRYLCWNKPDQLFLKTSLFFLLLSTLGIWTLGMTMAKLGKDSVFYSISVQFFLHFQINGWFLFGLLSFIINVYHKYTKEFPKKINWFYISSLLATLLGFALPLMKDLKLDILYWLQNTGNIFQLFSLIYFIRYIHPTLKKAFKLKSQYIYYIYIVFLIAYTFKSIIQLLLILPELTEYSILIRNLYIGFIHLVVLGMYSTFLFIYIGFFSSFKINTQIFYLGAIVFTVGFLSTEFLLFLQGISLFLPWKVSLIYFQMIPWFSLFLLFGISGIIISIMFTSRKRI